jgi:cytochrome c-type biogenesis protein CcmF
VAAVITAVLLFIFGIREFYAMIAFPVCVFVIGTILSEWFRGVRARHRIRSENYIKAFTNLIAANAPRYGGYIVHIAIILITIGVVGSSLYDVENDATLKPGESMSINNYTLTYDNIDSYETESKTVVTTTLSVRNSGKLIARLSPEKYFHRSYEQPVTEVAIRSTLKEDLYVILVGWETDGTATFKVLVNPLIKWMWIGSVVLVLGGVIAFWPETRPPSPPSEVGRRRQEQ